MILTTLSTEPKQTLYFYKETGFHTFKMALESLLEPVTWVDEQILREYTKLVQIGESKGIGKYSLATGLNIVAKVFLTPAFLMS